MFVVLQPGDYNNPELLEAFVRITDDTTCKKLYAGSDTDPMVCTGTLPYAYQSPCYVR